ncbi:MAG: hypothetical protein ABSF26_13275 [Thermoguttaceae bacterium]|jgi:hypothetical protein
MAVVLALVLGLVATVQAAPLELQTVAADAKWVVHVDIDAVHASMVFQKARDKCLTEHKEIAQHLAKLPELIGMDPRKDLHGVTAYGPQIGKHTGVLIVHAKVNQKLLLEKAEKAPDHKLLKQGGYEIHTWSHKGPKGSHTVAGAFFKPEVLVFSDCPVQLQAALDVLAGKQPGAGSSSPLAGKIPPGTSVLLRVAGIAAADLPGKVPPLVKQIDSARFVVGENEGKSFFRAKANMTNTEVTGQVKAIIDGGVALAKLHCNKDELAKKLIDALHVTADGKTLTILWSAPAGDVWEMVQKHAKIMAEKWAKQHHKPGGPQGEKKGDAKGCPSQPAPVREDEF